MSSVPKVEYYKINLDDFMIGKAAIQSAIPRD